MPRVDTRRQTSFAVLRVEENQTAFSTARCRQRLAGHLRGRGRSPPPGDADHRQLVTARTQAPRPSGDS